MWSGEEDLGTILLTSAWSQNSYFYSGVMVNKRKSALSYLVADLSTENLVKLLLNNLFIVFCTSELKKQ